MRFFILTPLLMTLLASHASAQYRAHSLGTHGGETSIARDINDAGQVIGESETAQGDTHAFLWTDGVFQELLPLKGHRYSMANGLNNRGQAVGYSAPSAGGAARNPKAMLWLDGSAIALKGPIGSYYSQASEINDREEIVGISNTRAVVWRNRKAKYLPDLGGGMSAALGINSQGWIIGNSMTSKGQTHACVWIEDKVIDLGTLGGIFSNANGINDHGQIVGTSQAADGSVRSFIWENGKMRDLGPAMIRAINNKAWHAGEMPNKGAEAEAYIAGENGLRFDIVSLEGSSYTSAMAINNTGTVVGLSSFGSSGVQATVWKIEE